MFEPPSEGTCIFCLDEVERVVKPTMSPEDRPVSGICDVCSYALAREWRRARGEKIGASSPVLIHTYVLVPTLQAGRPEEDLGSYSFLVGEDGRLPHLDFVKAHTGRHLTDHLEREHGILTWNETLRPCYVGYDAGADLSEVLLAWAWGKISLARGQMFATFSHLLSEPTPEAGFYLGVKEAFEGLLARRELDPEGSRVCVRLREPAVRYLRAQSYYADKSPAEVASENEEHDMIALYHAAMSSEELGVAGLLAAAEEASRDARRDAAVAVKKVSPATEGDEEGSGDEDDGEVAEGFARPTRTLGNGEP